MLQKTISTIISNFREEIHNLSEGFYEKLLNGDLLGFEEELFKKATGLYNSLAQEFVERAANSKDLEEKARVLSKKKNLKSVRKTRVKLQLKTGKVIKINSLYALKSNAQRKRKSKRKGPNGKGKHLLLEYWGCVDKASVSYYSYATMLSVICPSFEIALRILQSQNIKAEYKRIRRLSYEVGNRCFNQRTRISRKSEESLAGKRVIISVDGGKTRTRITNKNKPVDQDSKNKRERFDTPWREPKMFVIHVLEKDGSSSKKQLPIYDGLIAKPDPLFGLLFCYLKQMQIEKAQQIIFVSDGAHWIWPRVNSLFQQLKVESGKVYQVIDYYHAVQHVYSILRVFDSKQLDFKQKQFWTKELKSDLYYGRIPDLIQKATDLANGRKRILNEIEYFRRHSHRMNYPHIRSLKLPIGSGIIESAIRRIINLRFKSPSTFWDKKNVEKLIFLRGVFLAKRWNIMITNLSQRNLILHFGKQPI